MREESKASDRGETPRTREGGRGYSNNRMSYSIINVGQIGMHSSHFHFKPLDVVEISIGEVNPLGCMSVFSLGLMV